MTVAQPSSSTRSPCLHRPALPHAVPMPRFSSPQATPIYPPWRDSCLPTAHFARLCKNTETTTLTIFRINTCKSVSKQMTLTPFRINTYGKHRGGGYICPPSHAPCFRERQSPDWRPLPPSYAPRNASIPCALIRLRILPFTTGVYPACCLQRFLGALCASVAVHPLPITRVGGGKGAQAEAGGGKT